MGFFVNPDNLIKSNMKMFAMRAKMAVISSKIGSTVSDGVLQDDCYYQVRDALRICKQNAATVSQNLSQVDSALQNIVSNYISAEKRVLGKNSVVVGSTGGVRSIFSKVFSTSSSKYAEWWYNGSKPGKIKYSIFGAGAEGELSFLGLKIAGYKGEFGFGNFEARTKGVAEWDTKKGNAKIEGSAKASISVVEGSIEGTLGLSSYEAKASVGNAAISGAVGATLFSEGQFAPSLYIKGKAEASVAEGEIEAKTGNDDYNVHAKAKGTVLGAKAEAKGAVGKIVDEDGTTRIGVSGKVGAEAYVAEGSVSAGFTLFGIKFDASIEGKVGGAGAKVGGEATNSSVQGEIGAGLGLGLGIKFKVDWSGFKWPWQKK